MPPQLRLLKPVALIRAKNKGGSLWLPPRQECKRLEVQAERELQLTHRGPAFYIRYLPVVATLAVNATIGSIIAAECVDWVVKDVKSVHAELKLDPLSDGNVLHQGEVRIEP